MTVRVSSISELEALARSTIAALHPQEVRATIIGLSGDLGSGKTAFTKAIAHELGVTGEVTSPTFVISKRYPLTHPLWDSLIHIDAYRLKGSEELLKIRWREIAANPRSLIVVEWPEIVSLALPEDTPIVVCVFVNEHTRDFLFPPSLIPLA